MRFAWLALMACSTSSADPKALPRLDATFRWAASPIECSHGMEGRSNRNRCHGADGPKRFLVVGYAATGPSDPRISVMRYDGESASAPQRWSQALDLGAHPGEPVVAVRDALAVIAAVSDGAVTVVVLDAATGAMKPSQRIVERDALRVQIAAADKELRIHVMMRDGSGRVIALDPAGTPIGARDVAARMLRMKMDPAATSADGEATTSVTGTNITARWDGVDLVIKHPKWTHKLVDGDRFRMQALTLHATADRVLITLHEGGGSGAAAFALDAATGAEVWKRGVTGIGPVAHSMYYSRVASLVTGDVFAVQGYEAGGTYVCTLATKDGTEHACVDHLGRADVIDPGPILHPPRSKLPPAPPLGPQTKGPTCVKLGTPGNSLTVKRADPQTISGVVTTPSATCKPKLGGGIMGDRILVEVWDGGDKPGPAACTCTFTFTQAIRPESKQVIARVRGGVQLGQLPVPP